MEQHERLGTYFFHLGEDIVYEFVLFRHRGRLIEKSALCVKSVRVAVHRVEPDYHRREAQR